jgi:hypothetical protein
MKSYPGQASGPSPDPTTYVERVAEALQSRRGERVHLEAVVGGDPWILHESVSILREFGWVIIGERGKAGYTYLRWTRPRRWQRIERVCREHVAAVAVYPRRRSRLTPGHPELELEEDAA